MLKQKKNIENIVYIENYLLFQKMWVFMKYYILARVLNMYMMERENICKIQEIKIVIFNVMFVQLIILNFDCDVQYL